jgi:hypothetical protein
VAESTLPSSQQETVAEGLPPAPAMMEATPAEPASAAGVETMAEALDSSAPVTRADSAVSEPVVQMEASAADTSGMGDEADEEEDPSESAIGKQRRGIRLKQDLN